MLSIRGFLCHAWGAHQQINLRRSEAFQKRARPKPTPSHLVGEPKMVNSKLTNRPDHTEKKRRDWNVMGDSILFWTLLAVIAANSLLVAVAVLNVRRASR